MMSEIESGCKILKSSERRVLIILDAAENVPAGKNIGKTLFKNLEAAKILDFLKKTSMSRYL